MEKGTAMIAREKVTLHFASLSKSQVAKKQECQVKLNSKEPGITGY